MHPAILYVAVGICAVVAYQDVRTRRIPNAASFAMATLGLFRIALTQDAVAGGYTLAVGAVIFAVTFTLFKYGVIGGGDAKLIPAIVLVIGYRDLPSFLFLMSLCGGALAIATIAVAKLETPLKRRRRLAFSSSPPEMAQPRAKASTVPYGLAVAAAGVITLIASR